MYYTINNSIICYLEDFLSSKPEWILVYGYVSLQKMPGTKLISVCSGDPQERSPRVKDCPLWKLPRPSSEIGLCFPWCALLSLLIWVALCPGARPAWQGTMPKAYPKEKKETLTERSQLDFDGIRSKGQCFFNKGGKQVTKHGCTEKLAP